MLNAFSKNKAIYLALGAIGAGFLSGLIGAGGGIILYFTLGAIYGKGAKENLIVSSVAVMFFCVISLIFYKGNHISDISKIILPAILGGMTGAMLLARLPSATVKKLFSAVIIVSGILMLIK